MAANMNRSLSTTIAATCLLGMAARPMAAAEIRVVTANLLQPGLIQLAEQFKAATGHDVKIEAPRGAELNRILGSDEPADLLVGTAMAVDQAITDGRVA